MGKYNIATQQEVEWPSETARSFAFKFDLNLWSERASALASLGRSIDPAERVVEERSQDKTKTSTLFCLPESASNPAGN